MILCRQTAYICNTLFSSIRRHSKQFNKTLSFSLLSNRARFRRLTDLIFNLEKVCYRVKCRRLGCPSSYGTPIARRTLRDFGMHGRPPCCVHNSKLDVCGIPWPHIYARYRPTFSVLSTTKIGFHSRQ